MWVLANIDDDSKVEFYLPCGRKLYVGRQATLSAPPADNIALIPLAESSISRQHAVFEASPLALDKIGDLSARPTLTLTDLGSKFGTLVNDSKAPPNEALTLTENDIVAFGARKIFFKVKYLPLVFCGSSLPSEEKKAITSKLLLLGGHYQEQWTKDSTHLIMTSLKVTAKVARVLACSKPIVGPSWLTTAVSSSNLASLLPPEANHLPESSQSVPGVSYHPDARRKTLFRDKIFLFLSPTHYAGYHDLVREGGGLAVLYTAKGKEMTQKTTPVSHLDPNAIVVKGLPNEFLSSKAESEWVHGVELDLSKHGLVSVGEMEIVRAILLIDLITYCNPRKSNHGTSSSVPVQNQDSAPTFLDKQRVLSKQSFDIYNAETPNESQFSSHPNLPVPQQQRKHQDGQESFMKTVGGSKLRNTKDNTDNKNDSKKNNVLNEPYVIIPETPLSPPGSMKSQHGEPNSLSHVVIPETPELRSRTQASNLNSKVRDRESGLPDNNLLSPSSPSRSLPMPEAHDNSIPATLILSNTIKSPTQTKIGLKPASLSVVEDRSLGSVPLGTFPSEVPLPIDEACDNVVFGTPAPTPKETMSTMSPPKAPSPLRHVAPHSPLKSTTRVLDLTPVPDSTASSQNGPPPQAPARHGWLSTIGNKRKVDDMEPPKPDTDLVPMGKETRQTVPLRAKRRYIDASLDPNLSLSEQQAESICAPVVTIIRSKKLSGNAKWLSVKTGAPASSSSSSSFRGLDREETDPLLRGLDDTCSKCIVVREATLIVRNPRKNTKLFSKVYQANPERRRILLGGDQGPRSTGLSNEVPSSHPPSSSLNPSQRTLATNTMNTSTGGSNRANSPTQDKNGNVPPMSPARPHITIPLRDLENENAGTQNTKAKKVKRR